MASTHPSSIGLFLLPAPSLHFTPPHPASLQVPFFTLPPDDGDESGGGLEGAKKAEAMFVEGFGKEFDVEAGDAEVGVTVHIHRCKQSPFIYIS